MQYFGGGIAGFLLGLVKHYAVGVYYHGVRGGGLRVLSRLEVVLLGCALMQLGSGVADLKPRVQRLIHEVAISLS